MNSKDQLALLSDDERRTLSKFQEKVQDILQPHRDEYYLLRWLKARNFDIQKAEKMIRESFKFRKKINAEELVNGTYQTPEVYRNYRATASLGFDKEGSIMRLILGGMCDTKGYMYSLHPVDVLKLVMYIFESDMKALDENNKKNNLHEYRTVLIIDMRDFVLRHYYDKHVIHVMIQLINMYQDNYPEMLKVAFIINAPAYFYWVWNLFKPFMNESTLNKIRIYGTDNTSWKQQLLDLADPKQIPAFLGGVLCDPDGDPTCQTLIKWDIKIPVSYYLKDKYVLRPDDADVKVAVVPERSHFEHKVSIEKPGSTMRWEFQTKDYNIRFGVLYKKSSNTQIEKESVEELLPVENVECQVIPENGQLQCEKVGQYILHFDNTYSWLTSKQLIYKVTVTDPEDD